MIFKSEEKKPELTIEEEIEAAKAKLAELEKVKAEKVEAEREVARAARKEEAEVVKATIAQRLEGEATARKAKAAAYKVYLEACDAEQAKVEELKKAEKEALSEFCKKHPEGFHDTITIGDATYRYDYSTNPVSYVDPFQKLLDFWF